MPLNRDVLQRTYGPSTFDVDREFIRRFAGAVLDDNPVYRQGDRLPAPPTSAFVPCWPVIQEALADPDLGAAPGQIIHGEQVIRFHRTVAEGSHLVTTGTVTRIEPKGRNEIYVLTLESRDSDGGLVVEQDNICVSLGSAETPPDGGSEGAGSKGAGSKAAVASGSADQGDGEFSVTRAIPTDIATTYSQASGDHSRVHLDADFARSLGFPGVIVHGMCLLSVVVGDGINRAAGGRPELVEEIRVRFAAPLEPGEDVRTEYATRQGGLDFETFSADGRKVLGSGMLGVAQRPLLFT